MKHGTQKKLSKKLKISPPTLCRLLCCQNHAAYPLAQKLAQETGTAAELWLRGGTGTKVSRQAAFTAWALGTNEVYQENN